MQELAFSGVRAGARSLRRHGSLRNVVAVGEELVQLSSNEPSDEDAPDDTQGQFVDDAILKPTGTATVGRHSMSVIPSFERAGDLDVAKLAAFDVVTVLEDPANAKRSEPDSKNAAIAIANSGRSLLDFHRLPGRRETFERAGLGMPAEEFFGGRVDPRACHELHLNRHTFQCSPSLRTCKRAENSSHGEKMSDWDYFDSDATGFAVTAWEPTSASPSGAANSDRFRPALFAR